MSAHQSNLRGIAFMVLATASFSANDALMKITTAVLPPFEVIFIRGVLATIIMLPLVLVSGNGPQLKHVTDKWVLVRNGLEFVSVLAFIVALANMPIADIAAIGQISPILLLLGVSLIYREKIGGVRLSLIALGFTGALLVAQPGGSGWSPFAWLGFISAATTALRDIAGRRVGTNIPAVVVAYGTVLVVMAGSGIATAISGGWVMPEPRHLLLLTGSAVGVTLGHLFIFLSYRYGQTAAVAPFYYLFSLWSVLSGAFVFGTFPNTLAVCGILLILVSGIAVVLLDERRRRLMVLA